MIMSSVSSHPLFSTLLAFSALILLYFPPLLWTFLFSPVFLLTAFLFLSLLRLGATQSSFLRHQQTHRLHNNPNPNIQTLLLPSLIDDQAQPRPSPPPHLSCPCFQESFVQWNVRAPLEVIYEDYEEEEEEEEDDKDVSNEIHPPPFKETESPQVGNGLGIQRYPSLSLYYPETDSDTSSDDEFPTPGAWDSLDNNMCFQSMWDDDQDRDELIEIALDKYAYANKQPSEFQFEDDNLIEIDISPTRITNPIVSFPT